MSNFNLNKVILGGRLTADPELKTTPSGISVTTFTVAVNRRFGGKDEKTPSDFFTVTAWRGTAELVVRYFRKASGICVVGSLQNRSWVDQTGQKHYATEIAAGEVYFVDAKSDRPEAIPGAAPAPAAAKPEAGVYTTIPAAELEEVPSDEELPF